LASHNELGKEGELMAVQFLLKNGYLIKEQNYRFKKAEIDIIALKDKVLAVVEVKTRSTDFFGEPYEFVKPKQQKLIYTAIDDYVIQNDLEVDVRFDIISIVISPQKTSIEHLTDAFFPF
jgi:putative endonuclease